MMKTKIILFSSLAKQSGKCNQFTFFNYFYCLNINNAYQMSVDSEKIKQHLCDSSRSLADLTANMIYDDITLLKPLLEVIWSDEDPWSNRASRIFSICCCRFPDLIKPYAAEIVKRLNGTQSEGVIRNMLLIFAEVPVKLSEKSKSILMNLCFDYLEGNTAVAIKVYSMEILYGLCHDYPDIMHELYSIIE